MAMTSTVQKPIQRERFGELLEGLPGSIKSVACVERNVKNLGDPNGSCANCALVLSTTMVTGRHIRNDK
jgi:hypothetical protein